MLHGSKSVLTMTATLLVVSLSATLAFAHIGLGQAETFSTGFYHPLSGIDHVVAMVAVGLYAASLGGTALWLVPLSFVVTMMVGGILGFTQAIRCRLSRRASGFPLRS
jgi:urease accessory protein